MRKVRAARSFRSMEMRNPASRIAERIVRDGDRVFRTYLTEDRGVEHLGSHWTYLDLTPYGHQEVWEDSPAGWPQSSANDTRRHDEY